MLPDGAEVLEAAEGTLWQGKTQDNNHFSFELNLMHLSIFDEDYTVHLWNRITQVVSVTKLLQLNLRASLR